LGFEEEEEEDEDEGLVIDELKVARVEISEEMGTRVSGRSCGTFGSCGSSSMMRTQIGLGGVTQASIPTCSHKKLFQALQNPIKWHSGGIDRKQTMFA
jgi:hypothetical protein